MLTLIFIIKNKIKDIKSVFNKMIKLLTLKFLEIIKNFINLILTLLIKQLKSFDYFLILNKYINQFRTIFNYLKNFKHFFIFKYFIKTIAIVNLLTAIYTIFILTGFQNLEYIFISEDLIPIIH